MENNKSKWERFKDKMKNLPWFESYGNYKLRQEIKELKKTIYETRKDK